MAVGHGLPSVHREVIEMQSRHETEWLAFRAAAAGIAALVFALVVTVLLVAVTSGSTRPRMPSAPVGPSICLMDERPVPCS
jgi:hypothetical protein